MIGFDPLCQPYDPTSSAPFKILNDRIRTINERQIDQLEDLANFASGKSPFDRIGPYVRLPQTPFYSESANSEINTFFDTFLEKASVVPIPVGAQQAARHLQLVVDGAGAVGLSESQIKIVLPSLAAFNDWKAAHPFLEKE